MELSKQVCTLQQAKRLKELGVEQKSYFSHGVGRGIETLDTTAWVNQWAKEGNSESNIEIFSAFTVAELGEMLANVRYESFGFPLMFTSYSYNYDEMQNIFGKWACNYRNPLNFTNPDIKAENEADARAQMLIYLLESGTIKP